MRELGVDEGKILKELLRKKGVRVWSGFNWLRSKSSKGFLGEEFVTS